MLFSTTEGFLAPTAGQEAKREKIEREWKPLWGDYTRKIAA
jgi:hypothetical protein